MGRFLDENDISDYYDSIAKQMGISKNDVRFSINDILNNLAFVSAAKIPVRNFGETKGTLVVESPYAMSPQRCKDFRENLKKQLYDGVVLLPDGFRATFCPQDVEVRTIFGGVKGGNRK